MEIWGYQREHWGLCWAFWVLHRLVGAANSRWIHEGAARGVWSLSASNDPQTHKNPFPFQLSEENIRVQLISGSKIITSSTVQKKGEDISKMICPDESNSWAFWKVDLVLFVRFMLQRGSDERREERWRDLHVIRDEDKLSDVCRLLHWLLLPLWSKCRIRAKISRWSGRTCLVWKCVF